MNLSLWKGDIATPDARFVSGQVPRSVRDRVLAEVAATARVSVGDILSDTRLRHIAHARQEVMVRLRREMHLDGVTPKYSLPAIGRALNRTHWTVSHAVEAFERREAQAA